MTLTLLLCRKNCRNSHTLTTEHNLSVLKTHGVDHLSYSELCQLLFQNDPWLLPEVSAGRGWVCKQGIGKRPEGWKIENIRVKEKPRSPSWSLESAWRRSSLNSQFVTLGIERAPWSLLLYQLGWYHLSRASVRLREPVWPVAAARHYLHSWGDERLPSASPCVAGPGTMQISLDPVGSIEKLSRAADRQMSYLLIQLYPGYWTSVDVAFLVPTCFKAHYNGYMRLWVFLEADTL